jgi:toxin CptA
MLALVLLFMHGGALLVIPPLRLPVWLALLLSVAVIASLTYTLTTHALLVSRRAIVQLIWDAEGKWTLLTLKGERLTAQLQPTTYLHPHLVILNFRLGKLWERRAVVLLPDSVDADTFRRLRVRLALTKH